MDVTEILREIDAEIGRLEQAKVLLTGTVQGATPTPPKRGRKPVKVTSSFNQGTNAAKSVLPKHRRTSPEGRARIADAQKARWAAKDSAK